ncbi:MAG: group 1 truncated hemoglobin [Xanthomonadales bacterium]|nr:hypothetical protein [Xanthomonadales bacterium]MCC6593918.1 group 1 truncated hemoglobin [Xanthomonadales bacterium]MCE7932056.1 group 1 truncated hemoglobin [Xanthomonadales bacterium PRO6]
MSRLLLCALALLLGACASTRERSLYAQLGGRAGIERLVMIAVEKVHDDPRIGELFAQTDLEYLRERLVEQVCQLADGPCEYTGLSMPDTHSGMNLSEREFNWFVEDFEAAMREAGLPLAAQNRLLARLARLRGEIIRQ